jgi:hypothetical protein
MGIQISNTGSGGVSMGVDFWNSVEIGMFLELAFTPAERNFEEKIHGILEEKIPVIHDN